MSTRWGRGSAVSGVGGLSDAGCSQAPRRPNAHSTQRTRRNPGHPTLAGARKRPQRRFSREAGKADKRVPINIGWATSIFFFTSNCNCLRRHRFELTRLGGHLILREQGGHHGRTTADVHGGVSAADGGSSAGGARPGGVGGGI